MTLLLSHTVENVARERFDTKGVHDFLFKFNKRRMKCFQTMHVTQKFSIKKNILGSM